MADEIKKVEEAVDSVVQPVVKVEETVVSDANKIKADVTKEVQTVSTDVKEEVKDVEDFSKRVQELPVIGIAEIKAEVSKVKQEEVTLTQKIKNYINSVISKLKKLIGLK